MDGHVTTVSNHDVTTVTACNQCAEKDAEIARLREELLKMAVRDVKPKRDRAAYMRTYRSKPKADARGVDQPRDAASRPPGIEELGVVEKGTPG
jgi:formate-dependent nitrite reductase cytochrome c552 subunit